MTIIMITIPIKDTPTPIIIIWPCFNSELLFSCSAFFWDSVVCVGADVVSGDVLGVVVGIVGGAGVDVVFGNVLGVVLGIVAGVGVDVIFGDVLGVVFGIVGGAGVVWSLVMYKVSFLVL